MGCPPDGTTRLTSTRQVEVCRLCADRPRSVDELADAMDMAGGGAIDATVKRLARRDALVEGGFGPARGTRKRGARLWAMAPEWQPDLAVALARRAPGRVAAGTELVIVPIAALSAATEIVAESPTEFAWAARLADSTFALLLAAESGSGRAAVDRLLVELAARGSACVRVACGEPEIVQATVRALTREQARSSLPMPGF